MLHERWDSLIKPLKSFIDCAQSDVPFISSISAFCFFSDLLIFCLILKKAHVVSQSPSSIHEQRQSSIPIEFVLDLFLATLSYALDSLLTQRAESGLAGHVNMSLRGESVTSETHTRRSLNDFLMLEITFSATVDWLDVLIVDAIVAG